MLTPLRVSLLALLVSCWAATVPAADLGKDGFPTGNDTPEGAACDLARAFIRDDAALFLATCAGPYGGPEAQTAYHKFLESVVVQMKMEPAGSSPSPDAPEKLTKCFAARHLGKTPGGFTAFGFQDVMFVDVVARTHGGAEQICRTLVIENKDGRWSVDPQPEQSPLQITGLDEEPPSTREYLAAPVSK